MARLSSPTAAASQLHLTSLLSCSLSSFGSCFSFILHLDLVSVHKLKQPVPLFSRFFACELSPSTLFLPFPFSPPSLLLLLSCAGLSFLLNIIGCFIRDVRNSNPRSSRNIAVSLYSLLLYRIWTLKVECRLYLCFCVSAFVEIIGIAQNIGIILNFFFTFQLNLMAIQS